MDRIFSEHFVEHVTREQGLALFAECHRVLKPGGVLRLSTPSLEVLVAAYAEGRLDQFDDVGWKPETPCRLLNESMRSWGHQFVYDRLELLGSLQSAGFPKVAAVDWRKSDYPDLCNLECRPFHQELIVEAVR